MKIKQYTGILLVVMALAVLLLAPNSLERLFLKKLRSNDLGKQEQQSYQALCKVPDGCRLKLSEGVVSLRIAPGDLPALQPLDIKVELEGFSAQQVSMEFIGKDMPMGLWPFPLEREGGLFAAEHFTGEGSISLCTTDKNMVWLARLIISSESTVNTVVFELET